MNKLNLKPLLRLCKPPFYPARGCCRGFRVVACRYYRQLNNVESNCAASLFQHIAVKGSYPTGLFNVKCHRFGNTQGLSCEGFLWMIVHSVWKQCKICRVNNNIVAFNIIEGWMISYAHFVRISEIFQYMYKKVDGRYMGKKGGIMSVWSLKSF